MDYGQDMKNFLNIVLIISLAQVAHTAHASEITSIYTTGDVLTAATLDTIKNAVNDNDTRIDTMVATPSARVPYFFARPPNSLDDFNDPYPVGTLWVDTSSSGSDVYISIDSSGSSTIWKQRSPLVYALGDTGPGGGLVFYVTADGMHGLEVAPADSSSSEWGCENTNIARAEGTAIGTGQHNTVEILHLCSDADSAAQVATDYLANGYYDWFLPSKDELNQIFCVLGNSASARYTCSGLPDTLNTGTFNAVSLSYWSSSQIDTATANASEQSFVTGTQGGATVKNTSLGVRAVREF